MKLTITGKTKGDLPVSHIIHNLKDVVLKLTNDKDIVSLDVVDCDEAGLSAVLK